MTANTSFRSLASYALVYLPGLIMLVFSMLALHSAVMLMRAQEDYSTRITAESDALNKMHLEYETFEDLLKKFFENGGGEEKAESVKKRFAVFATSYRAIINDRHNLPNFEPFSNEYRKAVLKIDEFLVPVSLELQGLQETPSEVSLVRLTDLLEDLEADINDAMRLLGRHQFTISAGQQWEKRQNMLYWSVITVGLAGFILVLVNAYNIQRLKRSDIEKAETLAITKRRFQALEGAFDGIGIINQKGELTYMNAALRNLHGLSPEDAKSYIGEFWGKLYTEKGQAFIQSNVMPTLEEEGVWSGESPIVRKSGEIVYADLHIRKMVGEEGYVGMARNVTDKKLHEKASQELREQLYQAQKMEAVGRLAGGIAHDFNNILASMNGYAEFLIEDLEEESQQQGFAKNILAAGHQARRLVDQILAFSRRDQNPAAREHVDMATCIEKGVSMLLASLPKTIELKTDLSDRAMVVSGHESQISQLIMNLCVNAVDAMERERGTLRISADIVNAVDYDTFYNLSDRLPDPKQAPLIRMQEVGRGHARLFLNTLAAGRDYVLLSIQDSGCGMNRQVMERIFEPFFTTKDVDKGTGLGLSVVHGVIMAHSGALMVESIIDHGTTFSLFLPLSSQPASQHQEGGSSPLRLDGRRILIAEDQDSVREVAIEMLERMGAEAYGCASAVEALKTLRENKGAFDLVLTDQNMPHMTGLELVYQIHPEQPSLPFILISGYSEEKLRGLMLEHPAIKAILRKPISKDALANEIGRVLRNTL